jgi:hypothetical protein
MSFLDHERLAVTVVTRERGSPQLPTRGEMSAASPYRLTAILIETASGNIIGTPDWPSNSRFARVVATNDKGTVIERGDELTLLAPDLSPLKRMALPPLPADQYGHELFWEVHASSSGKRAVLVGGLPWTKRHWLWVDTENLEVLESWEDDATGPLDASDDQLVLEPSSQRLGDAPLPLEAKSPGGGWRPIATTVDALNPRFVGPDLLYFGRYARHDPTVNSGVFLMQADNAETSQLRSPHARWGFGHATTTRTGRRFVILLGETKGFHPALDIGGHGVLRGFMVFDPPFKAPSYTLEVHGSRVWNPSAALSPDGRHIAVLGYPKPLVEMFELPPASK